MSKIIIENISSISDAKALELVKEVIEMGRISGSDNNPQYCYLSTYRVWGMQVAVSARLNKNSDKFVVCDDNRRSDNE